ncbi:DUF2339 domain-containing protein [Pedobacter alpinus]|uniref:DUF2339 domain-containing protein n=1 Tax=Pedobacter alpinus TaxID=1590643 RepID=A0ABW5TMP6_9SPHI
MEENDKPIDEVLLKLETLLKKQENFNKEIAALRQEVNVLKSTHTAAKADDIKPFIAEEPVKPFTNSYQAPQPKVFEPFKYQLPKTNTFDWEKFVGENLINKIGIAITIIGVAIGAKYSIEHELISPLTRIILGYVMGIALLAFGIKLKQKYESYSAVLVSGAIAIMYFITFAAYSFYGLFPQLLAFALMLLFTVFTVVAAINYNKQVIALIGLVGAYAVPFLLSEGSGNVAVLFAYISIINAGILFLAFKKYWKSLYYASFIFTWLIFASWFITKYIAAEYFNLSLAFLGVFFATFYAVFLIYKLSRKEKYQLDDILLLLANSFVFYGFGFAILSSTTACSAYLGLFTLFNAIIHFIVGSIIYKQKLADKNLFYLVAGLVLVFITVTIPVQLDGNWVTIVWACEAALLFWIGRTKEVSVYEKLSYILMFLGFFSLLQDYYTMPYYYGGEDVKTTPFFNVYFLTGIIFVAAFSFINKLFYSNKYKSALTTQKNINLIGYSITGMFLLVLYWVFRMEIVRYWDQLFTDSIIEIKTAKQTYPNQYYNFDLRHLSTIWVINYSLLFFSILSIFNIKALKNRQFAFVNLAFNTVVLLAFLIQGLYVLSELRESYIHQTNAQYYEIGILNIAIRYICYLFLVLVILTSYQIIKKEFIKPVSKNLKIGFDLAVHISIVWILSSELITWLNFSVADQSYKLGLSILWGVYALFLIAIGIWKNKQHIRIGAIALFSVTLVKLFFYDISQMETIAKTVIFVALGVLLLIISFLYNKYKHIITNETED